MEQNLLLSNVSIVVTRPAKQNKAMCFKIEQLGASPISFPCIEIIPQDCAISPSNPINLAIFISPNAVEYGLPLFQALDKNLTANCQFVAVGTTTAQALNAQGLENVLSPKNSPDSESLLKLPELVDIENKSVLIIKGTGGRTLIKETLINRGASVHILDAYERAIPRTVDIHELNSKIDLILFTSNESAQNFLALIPDFLQKSLLNCQTIVGHPRIAEKVTSLGFKNLPIIATSPSDRDMLSAVKKWAHKNGEK